MLSGVVASYELDGWFVWPTLGTEVIILSTLGGAAMSVAVVTSVSLVIFCVPVASLKMSASCLRAVCFRE